MRTRLLQTNSLGFLLLIIVYNLNFVISTTTTKQFIPNPNKTTYMQLLQKTCPSGYTEVDKIYYPSRKKYRFCFWNAGICQLKDPRTLDCLMCSNAWLYVINKAKKKNEFNRIPNYYGLRTVWTVFGFVMSLLVLIAIIMMGKYLTDIRREKKYLGKPSAEKLISNDETKYLPTESSKYCLSDLFC